MGKPKLSAGQWRVLHRLENGEQLYAALSDPNPWFWRTPGFRTPAFQDGRPVNGLIHRRFIRAWTPEGMQNWLDTELTDAGRAALSHFQEGNTDGC